MTQLAVENKKDNTLTIRFDEELRKGDEVENLAFALEDADIGFIGEAYTQMDGTCPAMLYSYWSDLVYTIDLVGDYDKLMRGETVVLVGRTPSAEDRELIENDIY